MLFQNKDVEVAKPALKIGLVTVLISFVLVAVSGDLTARLMTTQQPMKMAAAEAVYDTKSNVPFSLLTVGTLNGNHSVFQIGLPSVLSFMATGNVNGTIEGVNNLEKSYQQKYGVGNYKPNIPFAYWSFRLMIGFGALAALISLLALWFIRIALPFLPILANSFGWIFTESARQPWVVFGLFKTSAGVSPGVSAASVLFTMVVFTLLYGVLAVIEFGLIMRTIKVGPEKSETNEITSQTLTMAY